MARIFRLLPNPTRAHEPGGIDPPKATIVSLAIWQNRRNRFKELRRRGVPKFHAAVAAGPPTGFWRMSGHPAVQQACATRISTVTVFPASVFLTTLNSIEPPWYGPVCPVVWEGRRREAFPYPDQCPAETSDAAARATSSPMRSSIRRSTPARRGARHGRMDDDPLRKIGIEFHSLLRRGHSTPLSRRAGSKTRRI
jgi:hypothetical protein